MNYSEKIHDYLDGILDHSEEADLLTAIAQHSELRDELRHLIALKAAFKADVQALTPPPHLTSNIFANLGFASPAAPAQIIPTQVMAANATRVGVSNSILTGIVSSLLTAILLLSWNMLGKQGNAQESGIANVFADHRITNTPPLTYWRVTSAPTTTSRTQAFTRQTPMRQIPTRPTTASMLAFEQSSSSELSSKSSSEIALKQAQQHDVSPKNTLGTNQNLYDLNTSSQPTSASTNIAPKLENIPPNLAPNLVPDEEESWLQRIQIQARRIVSTSIPPTDFPSNPSSFLRNTALGAMVKLSDRHSIGLECSEETFYQRFQERSQESDAMVTIQQNPSLFWAGISYRYLLLEKPVHGFNPFFQGLVGATALGATGRAMLGLNYSPDAKTEFTLGVETSTLLFLHQGVPYASPKLGFSYGVSLRF